MEGVREQAVRACRAAIETEVRQRGLGSLLTSGMATITGPERIGDEIQLVWEHIESSPYGFRATTLTLALYQNEAKRFTSARASWRSVFRVRQK